MAMVDMNTCAGSGTPGGLRGRGPRFGRCASDLSPVAEHAVADAHASETVMRYLTDVPVPSQEEVRGALLYYPLPLQASA